MVKSPPVQLQRISFRPPEAVSHAHPLYVRGPVRHATDGSVIVPAGTVADFDTYFNILDCPAWQTLTGLSRAILELSSRGRGSVQICATPVGGSGSAHVHTRPLAGGPQAIRIDRPITQLLWFRIHAETDVVLASAAWTGMVERPAVTRRVAVVICTFRRESYVLHTLADLKACLPDGWHIYVIDNGRTLRRDQVDEATGRVVLVPNENTGGAGGFTRGIREALASETPFDYALLMDDDVLISPEAIERTDTVLKYLLPRHSQAFLSGAMLRLDEPTVQHEATALWNGWRVRHMHGSRDLSVRKEVSAASRLRSRRRQYAAWWYCAVPLSQDMCADLPAPLFLNGDDIEYSLRRARGILRMNGIAIWHESFAGKVNEVKHIYLTVRNGLIINLMHGYSVLSVLLLIGIRFLIQWTKGRQSSAGLIVQAVRDVVAGPDHVRSIGNPFEYQPAVEAHGPATARAVFQVTCVLLRRRQTLRDAYILAYTGTSGAAA